MYLLLLLTACQDYKLQGTDEDPTPFDTGDTFDPGVDSDSDAPPPTEECNGVDDDGDGLVDEDYPDTDGDGVADCEDDACELTEPPPRSEVREDCQGSVGTGSPPADPWKVDIEWQRNDGAGVVSTPAVGDLDGDGVPEVLYQDDKGGGRLVVLDGASGALEWEVAGMDPYSGPSVGDIDNDGFGDVVTSSGGCFSPHVVYAFDHTGAKMWERAIGNACETYANLTDLDGDGDVEVIMNEYVLDGATGSVEATLAIDGANNWGAPAVADMDQDGDLEILLENRMYDHTGALLMTCGSGGTGSFPQPVNVDGDDAGEFLVAGYGKMTLCDDTGAVLWSRSYSSYGTAVAVADFDNDGVQEFAFAQSGNLSLIESDGSNRWVTAVNDYSGLAGATSWDVDYDGVPEVVYADEQDIMVFNGATGAVVIRDPNHGSWTAAETPAVADVDGDGAGELVYGSNSGYLGITVIGGADGDWPYSRPVYNQYTYYGANVEDDLSIPRYTEAPWMYPPNIFRGQPSAVYSAGVPNLTVAIGDLCFASCADDGRVDVWIQVWNDGGSAAPAGTSVRLYGHPGGVRTLIEDRPLGADLDAATSVELLFTTTAAAVGVELEVVVDEDGAEAECDETDNDASWADSPCY